MSIARALGTTTMLADGRVLVAGGSPTDGPGAYTALASAEIFDPQTDRFTPTGSMAAARIHASATLLQDGRVLMVGGEDLQGSGRLAEIYDPAAGTFRVTGPMTTARRGLAAVMLESGQVLVVGGDTRGGKTAELYNP
jgi:N-acetylneuraminic acid mutarotase